MKRYIGFFIICCICGLLGCGRGGLEKSPTAAPESTGTILQAIVPTAVIEPTKALAVTPPPTKMPTVTPLPTIELTATPVPTRTPEPALTPSPTVAPTSAPVVEERRVIVIDPGHQAKGNYGKEPVGPGATELKTKVSSGTQGVSTKVPEHVFTLELSLKLRDALVNAGDEVVLTREIAEVDISNVERAEVANVAGADIYIRVHADGAENKAANGISVLYPSENNPYVAELSADSKRLAQAVLDGMCETTGAKNRGIIKRDDLSGTNWAKMPVILIEAGFMTNEAEEKKLLSTEYQELLVQGIVAGVEEYWNE